MLISEFRQLFHLEDLDTYVAQTHRNMDVAEICITSRRQKEEILAPSRLSVVYSSKTLLTCIVQFGPLMAAFGRSPGPA